MFCGMTISVESGKFDADHMRFAEIEIGLCLFINQLDCY
jgi:hypothetical protein